MIFEIFKILQGFKLALSLLNVYGYECSHINAHLSLFAYNLLENKNV